MKKILIIIYRYLTQFWINPIQTIKWIKNLWFYIKDYFKIKKNNKKLKIKLTYPCLHDKNDSWWIAKWHYFHQDLSIARKIFENNPEKHIDIWSRIDWFIAHLAVFREVEVFDIRILESKTAWIIFKQANLMDLDKKLINYTDSISSLHALEHFWLWRYWDPINLDWHIKWLDNIYKILKKWWVFYFSAPIWEQRIEFNAHRIFSVKYLIDLFKDKYIIKSFSYVDDNWNLHENINIEKWLKNNFNCNYGCWIFELIKS